MNKSNTNIKVNDDGSVSPKDPSEPSSYSTKPQANGLDEIEPILRFMLEKLVFGGFVVGKVPIAEAKQQIQALITEARIDEVKRIDPTSDYVLNDLVMSVGDRLTQLKENK
jgi:hypothetical protein